MMPDNVKKWVARRKTVIRFEFVMYKLFIKFTVKIYDMAPKIITVEMCYQSYQLHGHCCCRDSP